jgi:deoxyadenosine/deoxycytidine kinase
MIIAVEGNIGAGKSTFLKVCNIGLSNGVHVVYENVDEWTSLKDGATGLSIFDLFYQEKDKYTFVFQSYVLLSRIHAIRKAVETYPDKVILCERSFFTDLEVFAKSLRDANELSDVEWQVYNRWHKLVQDVVNIPIAGQIYLRAKPCVCLERVKTRARQSENLITKDYLETLHNQHERWLSGSDVPTLVVDANMNYVMNEAEAKDLCKMVDSFIDCIKET